MYSSWLIHSVFSSRAIKPLQVGTGVISYMTIMDHKTEWGVGNE